MNYFWLRIVEIIIFSIIVGAVLASIIGIPYAIVPVILFFTYLLLGLVEYTSTTPIIHVFLPISLFGVGLLSSRMIYGTIDTDHYVYVMILYMLSAFILYTTIYSMTRVILGERSHRFTEEYKTTILLMNIFLVTTTTLTIWLTMEKAIQIWASVILITLMWTLWIASRYYVNKKAIELTIFKQIGTGRGVFKHPQEPEVERALLTLIVFMTIPVFAIPLLFIYTKFALTQRSFIPLALLGIYEAMACLLYFVFHALTAHGAYIEELIDNRKLVRIEHYDVFETWEDASWFLNRSVGYYYRARYLTALYMLFQGLEILAKKHNLKELYYKNLHTAMSEGLKYIKNNNLTKYVKINTLEETLDKLNEENTWVIEASTKIIEEEPGEVKEAYKKLYIDLINMYLNIIEDPEKVLAEKNKIIDNTVNKLRSFIKNRISNDNYKKALEDIITKLLELKEKQNIQQEDLEFVLEKKPLTINMLRNYLVHGQLVRNAIVYKGSRKLFDELLSNPAILYSIYTLTIAYVVKELNAYLSQVQSMYNKLHV
ncbi:hypothetical protein J4526_00770 [Desulfurococcaceae archaeon MEX13E-LK6-19]|nr:hypothetical protein J4526_00770 [Desulfurococcaceae archaeon MEX13E-LK6-19]